jgi:hypothetical protein
MVGSVRDSRKNFEWAREINLVKPWENQGADSQLNGSSRLVHGLPFLGINIKAKPVQPPGKLSHDLRHPGTLG